MEYKDPIKGVEVAWTMKGEGCHILPNSNLSRVVNNALWEYPLEYLKDVKSIEVRLPEDLEAWYNIKK